MDVKNDKDGCPTGTLALILSLITLFAIAATKLFQVFDRW